MLDFYLIILLACVITIPILIHRTLKRKIKSSIAILTIEIVVGLTILFLGFLLPFYTFFSPMPDYPKVTKTINEHYYFTQQEYGWAGSIPGKHLEFFEKNKFWFDRKIGHINWKQSLEDIDAKILNDISATKKKLIIKQNNKIVLDTIFLVDKSFDFVY